MIIKSFDRNSCKVLSENMMKELEKVAKKYGVHVERGRGTFTGPNFDIKVKFSTVSDGAVQTKERQDYERFHASCGLPGDLLDGQFVYNNKVYTVIGLKPRSKKYPVLAEREDGKVFKFGANFINSVFADC